MPGGVASYFPQRYARARCARRRLSRYVQLHTYYVADRAILARYLFLKRYFEKGRRSEIARLQSAYIA